MVLKWPPLFLFSISLLAISLCCFGVGVYVLKHELKNPNVISWNSFMTEVTKHVFCSKTTPVAEVPSSNNSDVLHIEAVFRWNIAEKTLNPLSAKGSFVMLKGSVYNVSLSSLATSSGEHVACLHVSGQSSVLPSINSTSVRSPANCSAPIAAPPILPSLKPKPVVPDADCRGSSYHLDFQSDYRLDAFLSEEDRRLVYARMCRVSLLLLCLAAVIVIFHLARIMFARSEPVADKVPFAQVR